MKKIILMISLFTLLFSIGCAGPEKEIPLDLRERSMDWPSMRDMPGERPKPREAMEQR